MNEDQVAQFLIEKGYHLTALELYTENYERTGNAIECLSDFFEDSANFLMFEDMRSVSEISTSAAETSVVSNDAMRIKDDRIAVLEHEIKVLHDSLDEAQAQLQNKQNSVQVQSPPTNFVGPPDDSEDLILNYLISRYLQSRGLKLSALAFNNETSAQKHNDRINIPDDVDLAHLLRSFEFVQNSPLLAEEIDKLRNEKKQQTDIIHQLTVDLDFAKKQVKELQTKIDEMQEQSQQQGENENVKVEVQSAPVINEPPSVALLNDIWKQIPLILENVADDNKLRYIHLICVIYKYHPDRKIRCECFNLIFTTISNPNQSQIDFIVKELLDLSLDEDHISAELLPIISQYLSSNSVGTLCLISRVVTEFSPLASQDIRTSFLFSIVKQLAEHSSPTVRASACKACASTISFFDASSADRVDDALNLLKTLLFDSEAIVQSHAIDDLSPSVVNLCKSLHAVGKVYCEFWLKHMFSFGLTGSSALAALRFRLCTKAIEVSLPAIVPTKPTGEQQIAELNAENIAMSNKLVCVHKDELSWAMKNMITHIINMAPLYFVPINVKKDVDSLVSKIAKQFGSQFTNENTVPALLKSIDETEGDQKLKLTTLLVSAIIPYCGNETFFLQGKNFISYATSELRGFKSRDVQDYIAPTFSLMSTRDASVRPLIFQLIDDLSRSTRVAVRTAALSVLSEVLTTLEQKEIIQSVLPIVSRFAEDPDETLLLEVVNCVGAISRFSTALDVMNTIKNLFDKWFRGRILIRLQSLRVFAVIVSDVEPQFRDSYLIPKLQITATDTATWEEAGAREQALMIIMQILSSIEDFPENLVQNVAQPIVTELTKCDLTANDPKLPELKKKFGMEEQTSKFSLFSK